MIYISREERGGYIIKMGLASVFYQTVTKRTSTLVFAIVGSALVFERGFDSLGRWRSVGN